MPSVLLSTVGIMAFHKTSKVLIVKSIVLSDTEWLIPWKSSVDICLFVETMTWTKKACNVLCWRVWAAQREREVGVEELRKQKTLTNGGGPSGAAIGPSLTSSLIILMTRPRYTSTAAVIGFSKCSAMFDASPCLLVISAIYAVSVEGVRKVVS